MTSCFMKKISNVSQEGKSHLPLFQHYQVSQCSQAGLLAPLGVSYQHLIFTLFPLLPFSLLSLDEPVLYSGEIGKLCSSCQNNRLTRNSRENYGGEKEGRNWCYKRNRDAKGIQISAFFSVAEQWAIGWFKTAVFLRSLKVTFTARIWLICINLHLPLKYAANPATHTEWSLVSQFE